MIAMGDKSLTVKVLSADSLLFDDKAERVLLPGEVCPFEVLPSHAAMVSLLSGGEIVCTPAGATDASQCVRIKIKGGVARIENDNILACVEE